MHLGYVIVKIWRRNKRSSS